MSLTTLNPLLSQKLQIPMWCQKKRILVIEQEDDLREIFKLSLELVTNWQILTASSNAEALTLTGNQPPLAIVISTSTNNLSDWQVDEQIHHYASTHNIPLILMIDRVRLADQYQCSQQGAAAVVTTPSDPVDFAMNISRIVQRFDWKLSS